MCFGGSPSVQAAPVYEKTRADVGSIEAERLKRARRAAAGNTALTGPMGIQSQPTSQGLKTALGA